jgi:hypothetical protein
MSKTQIRRAIAIGVAALFVLIGAISMAEAGRGGGAGFKGGGFKGGSAFRGGNIHSAAAAAPSSTPIRAASTRIAVAVAVGSSTPIRVASTARAGRANSTTINATAITDTTADTAFMACTACRSILTAAGVGIFISER